MNTNDSSTPLKKLEKQSKPKGCRRKESIKIKTEISDIENRKKKLINKTRPETINIIDKPPVKLI